MALMEQKNCFQASAPLADAILNHPSVRPTAEQGDHRITVRALYEQGAVGYANDAGALVLFVPMEGGVWHGHVFAVAGSRGAGALALGRQALNRLFTDLRGRKLVSAVPLQLPAARVYCRRLGLRSVRRDDLREHFELEKEKWAVS